MKGPLVLIFASVVLSCSCIACQGHVEGGSVTALLDSADAYIANGDVKSAFASLKTAQSQASNTYERMGVYKRYLKLGDLSLAEKTVKKALRKDHDSKELAAIYGSLLLSQNRIKEALKVSRGLSGSQYGSVYAEAFMRNAINTGKSANELFGSRRTKADREWAKDETRRSEVFYDTRFAPVYHDAYVGSGRYRWNWNAAALSMHAGKYDDAAAMYPLKTESLEDALFWGTILYDAGRYPQSLEALLTRSSDTAPGDVLIKYKSLLADDYYILAQDAESERERSEILGMNLSEYAASNPSVAQILSQTYVNSALYYKSNDDHLSEYQRLNALVTRYPDYKPGLAAYGQFALDRSRVPKDDTMTAHIRAAGLQTRQMEIEAQIPPVSVDDALALVKHAIEKNSSPDLLVLEEELILQSNGYTEASQRVSRLWPLLERNQISDNRYPPEIVRYAVVSLIQNGYLDEACELFDTYEKEVYQQDYGKKSRKKKFSSAEHADEMELWECEVAAWFAIQNGDVESALVFYKTIIEKFAPRSPVMNVSGQNDSVVNSYVNAGNIYSGTNQGAVALDYLNKASSRATTAELKAEILYRIGKQNFYLNDLHSASKALQYALRLDPSHNKARFVLQQVNREQK